MTGIISDNVGRSTGLVKAAGGGGKILQAVGASDTTARTYGTASFSKASNTLDCAITPSSTSSKIFVSCSVGVYANGDFSCSIFRDTTNLGEAQDGCARIIGKSQYGGALLDSPATTSAVTYSFQINSIDGTTVSINYEGATAHMLVMEVGP
jgi:hypothetical protein